MNRMRFRVAVLAAVALAVPARAAAAPILWNAGTGSWFTAGNWNPAQVPTASDEAFINNGGTATALAGETPTASRILVGTAFVAGGVGAGTLNAAGSVSGLSFVGGAFTPLGEAAASGTGVVTVGVDATLVTFLPFVVGRAINGGSTASGSVTVDGTLRTAAGFSPPQAWQIGVAFGASANGSVMAGAVDTTAAPAAFLNVGVSAQGGTATGLLTLGAGELRVDGSADIGVANVTEGGSATGTVSLGGALRSVAANDAFLNVGFASSGFNASGTGSATGTLNASGISGFEGVSIGRTNTQVGTAVTASGTATVGSGGIVGTGASGSFLIIGDATGQPVNLAIAGPGATATGSATVGGDISGYQSVILGRVDTIGTATSALALSNGTLTTSFLSVGTVARTIAGANVTNGAASATGSLSLTDGAIVIAPPGFGSIGATRIGNVIAPDNLVPSSASGSLSLTRSSLTGGLLEIGTSFGGATAGGTGSVSAVQNSSIDVASVLMGFRGNGLLTLADSTLRVRTDPDLGLGGLMSVGSNSGSASVLATASDITVDRSLQIGASAFQDVASLARVSLADGSTLSVGESVRVGDFWPGNRAEFLLADSSATVGGNFVLGAAANNNTLFGEALLSVDASFLDIDGTLVMSVGAETLFGVQGTDRGLGGYGAIDALSALLAGALTVDFADLTGFGLASFDFDLISVIDPFTGGFASVSLLNVPTGYSASYGIFSVGESEVWRVTLSQVPEPSALALMLAALAGLALARRRATTGLTDPRRAA